MTEFIRLKDVLELIDNYPNIFISQDARPMIKSLPVFHINLEWFTGDNDGEED